MTSNSDSRSRNDHPRITRARNVLLWLAVIVVALFPLPWWP
jgi:hypothetical protein